MSIPSIIPAALAAALVLLVVRALGPLAVWDGQRLDVERCSAFTPPDDVRCNKACTLLGRFPRPGGRAVPPAG